MLTPDIGVCVAMANRIGTNAGLGSGCSEHLCQFMLAAWTREYLEAHAIVVSRFIHGKVKDIFNVLSAIFSRLEIFG
jgi:hypothetical protein